MLPGWRRAVSDGGASAGEDGRAWKAPRVAPGPQDGGFVAEVLRIQSASPLDWRCVLGLHPAECQDLQSIQSRYRHLMLMLHPDKRRKDEEAAVGGREVCDALVGVVQQALHRARKALEPDPATQAHERMRQMQELQRQQAREAQERQQRDQSAAAEAEAGALLANVERSLLLADLQSKLAQGAGSPRPAAASSTGPPPSEATQEILSLLAAAPVDQPAAAAAAGAAPPPRVEQLLDLLKGTPAAKPPPAVPAPAAAEAHQRLLRELSSAGAARPVGQEVPAAAPSGAAIAELLAKLPPKLPPAVVVIDD